MNFGKALEELRKGNKVARKGWNGKNQYVFLVKGEELAKSINFQVEDISFSDSLAMKTTKDQVQVGWLASQTDMLSDDWQISNVLKNIE